MFGSLVLGRRGSTDLQACLTSKHKQWPGELFPTLPKAFLSPWKRLVKQKIQTRAVETELMEC